MTDREAIRRQVREALDQKMKAHAIIPAAELTEIDDGVIDESVKDVITEADLRGVPAGGKVRLREDALITPSALDLIRDRHIEIVRRWRRQGAGIQQIVALGADHGGFEMKEQIKTLLDELGVRHRDFGTFSTEAVDYPDLAHAVARAVADGQCDLGIIVDGAGIGSCMTANKVPGVRAALCYDEATARNSREHNYANVLTLGARMIDREQMQKIVRMWLTTPEGEARHGKRVAKITAIERQYLR